MAASTDHNFFVYGPCSERYAWNGVDKVVRPPCKMGPRRKARLWAFWALPGGPTVFIQRQLKTWMQFNTLKRNISKQFKILKLSTDVQTVSLAERSPVVQNIFIFTFWTENIPDRRCRRFSRLLAVGHNDLVQRWSRHRATKHIRRHYAITGKKTPKKGRFFFSASKKKERKKARFFSVGNRVFFSAGASFFWHCGFHASGFCFRKVRPVRIIRLFFFSHGSFLCFCVVLLVFCLLFADWRSSNMNAESVDENAFCVPLLSTAFSQSVGSARRLVVSCFFPSFPLPELHFMLLLLLLLLLLLWWRPRFRPPFLPQQTEQKVN